MKGRVCFWVWLLCVFSLPVFAIQPGPNSSNAKHPLWKVRGERNSVYLLGTVHCLRITDYPLPAVVQNAFSNAPIAVFETDLGRLQTPAAQEELEEKARLPPGQRLPGELTLQTYERLKRYLAAIGLPSGIFDELKPSIVAITLELLRMEQSGFNPDYGLDQYLFQKARLEQKQILSLEPIEFQIDLLTQVSKTQGEFFMRATLDGLDGEKDDLGNIVQAWRTGNVNALEHLLLEGLRQDPGVMERMVLGRNRSWAPQIEDLLSQQRDAIVIVGAGHLVGEQGIIALLQSRGWEVIQE